MFKKIKLLNDNIFKNTLYLNIDNYHYFTKLNKYIKIIIIISIK